MVVDLSKIGHFRRQKGLVFEWFRFLNGWPFKNRISKTSGFRMVRFRIPTVQFDLINVLVWYSGSLNTERFVIYSRFSINSSVKILLNTDWFQISCNYLAIRLRSYTKNTSSHYPVSNRFQGLAFICTYFCLYVGHSNQSNHHCCHCMYNLGILGILSYDVEQFLFHSLRSSLDAASSYIWARGWGFNVWILKAWWISA